MNVTVQPDGTYKGLPVLWANNTQTIYELGDWGVQAIFRDEYGSTRGQDIDTVRIKSAFFNDVAVIDIAPKESYAYPTWIIDVNVTVGNEGGMTIDVNVSAYYSESSWHEIGTQNVTGLTPGVRTTVTFSWDLSGVDYCNYTIKGNTTLDGDADPSNNWGCSWVKVKMPGDVDGDGDVDADDVFMYVAPSYGKSLGQLGFNKQCNFDDDDDCDADDVFVCIAPNYGKRTAKKHKGTILEKL